MGKPIEGKTLRCVQHEISSALTSLRMHPDPIPQEDQRGNGWLCEVDIMAEHSVEHSAQAMLDLHSIEKRVDVAYMRLLKVFCDHRDVITEELEIALERVVKSLAEVLGKDG